MRRAKKIVVSAILAAMAINLLAVPALAGTETEQTTFTGEIPGGVVEYKDETILVSWYVDKNGNGTYQAEDGTVITFENVTIGSNNGQPGQGQLGLSTVDNARDLGGYITTDGKAIAQKRLLRSAKLGTLSDEDAQVLAQDYGLKQIFDLRSASEVTSDPDYDFNGAGYDVANKNVILLKVGVAGGVVIAVLPTAENADLDGNGTVEIGETLYYTNNMATTNYYRLLEGGYINEAEAPASGVVVYQLGTIIDGTNADGLAGLSELFTDLLSNEDGASLWHCSAGISRTALTAILVLSALGVDRETIVNDFLYSNDCYAASLEKLQAALRTVKLYNDIAEGTDEDGNAIFVLEPVSEDAEDVLIDEEGKAYRVLSEQEVHDCAYVSRGVYRDSAEMLLNIIDENYGCFANFWTEGLGLTMEQLNQFRNMYLD